MTSTTLPILSTLLPKFKRRSARYVARHTITPNLQNGLVSFSFDDCPRSVLETALPMIEAQGWRATIYASMGLCGTTNHLGLHMSEQDMLAAHEAGHEIADHTFSHIDAMTEGADAVLADIKTNRTIFEKLGLPRAETFAYPYGEVTPAVKRALASEFSLLRGVHPPSASHLDLNLAAAGRLYSDDIETTLALIEEAKAEQRWLILFGHDVRNNPSEFGCTPDELSKVLNRVRALDMDVLTVKDALKVLNHDAD